MLLIQAAWVLKFRHTDNRTKEHTDTVGELNTHTLLRQRSEQCGVSSGGEAPRLAVHPTLSLGEA